jgi:fucose permease
MHLPLGDLGIILIMVTIGSVAVSTIVGRALQRFGIAALLVASGAVAALGAVGFARASGLPMLLGLSLCFGVSAGITDGTLNTALAHTGRQRLLNLLHGFYGVGASIGPLLVTAAVLLGSWRTGYIVLAGFDLAVAALWLRHPHAYGELKLERDANDQTHSVTGRRRSSRVKGDLRTVRARVAWSLITFFVYVGLEVSAGQWETSFLRLHLHVSPLLAGVATFSYWAALTVARLTLAGFRRALNNRSIISVGAWLALVCTGVIWWNPSVLTTELAFLVLGASLAGIFPALVVLTPERVDPVRVPHLITWEIGAASAGGALLSGAVGAIISLLGLGYLGVALVFLSGLLILSTLFIEKASPSTTSPEY